MGEFLDLLLGKPFSIYHLPKTLEERFALWLDLFTEAIVRYQLDILQTILLGDGYNARSHQIIRVVE